jgi:regulatory protein
MKMPFTGLSLNDAEARTLAGGVTFNLLVGICGRLGVIFCTKFVFRPCLRVVICTKMSNIMWRQRTRSDEGRERVVADRERSRERTMNRAVKLLAAKPRSVRELRDRLLEKLWTDEPIVDAVIEKLKEYKYLDDDQFAHDLAVSKLRQRPQGKRRLQQSMSRQKLDKDLVATAIADAFEKFPEDDLIEQAIAKRLRLKGKPETRDDTKKFYDHLLRQGFGYDLIREKMAGVASGRFDQDGED